METPSKIANKKFKIKKKISFDEYKSLKKS